MQAELVEGGGKHLAGNQDGQVGAACNQAHKDGGQHGGADQTAHAPDALHQLLQDDGDAAALGVDAAEGEGAENQQDGAHHSHQAAPVEQGVDLGDDLAREVGHGHIEATVKGGHAGGEGEALNDHAHNNRQHRGEEHTGHGGLMEKGAQQYHNRGKEQNRVEVEHGLQGAQHLLDQLRAGHALLGEGEAHNGVDGEG